MGLCVLQDGFVEFVLDVGNPSVVNRLPAVLSPDHLVCVEGSSFLASGFSCSRVASRQCFRVRLWVCQRGAKFVGRGMMHRSDLIVADGCVGVSDWSQCAVGSGSEELTVSQRLPQY